MNPKNYNGWENLPTIQSKEILSELIESKEECRASLLVSTTGLGKSNTIDIFMKKYSDNTIRITVGDSYRIEQLMKEIGQHLGLPVIRGKNSHHVRMRLLKEYFKENRKGNYLIIIDEAENMSMKQLKAIKEIYDGIINHCSITLIGTEQILEMFDKRIGGQSVPQLKRRFKAGTRLITPIKKSRDFKPFFEKYIPNEKNLQDLLLSLCENYGELHDYLHPVLLKCKTRNVQVTEQIFRSHHKIASTK